MLLGEVVEGLGRSAERLGVDVVGEDAVAAVDAPAVVGLAPDDE
ncbi:hypothetical protein ACFO1B_43940 [Dactylosporangium siamense]|nr:hypothetical protein [Dactylosporangium siamense]